MNITPKRLLMTSPWLKYVKKAKEEGFYLIAIWDDADNKKNLPEISKYADELFIIQMDDTEYLRDLIHFIHKRCPIDIIYHLGKDRHTESAYKIANELGLALNTPETIQIMNDKLKMRAYLEKYQFSTVRYMHAQAVTDVREKLYHIGYPCIVKPVNLSGSCGVRLLANDEQLSEWEADIQHGHWKGPFMIEEYLEGPEVSVEAITCNGVHHIVGVTDKIKTEPPLRVELGHIHPSQLPQEDIEHISGFVKSFLDLIEYRFGPSHTEIILTSSGPKIIETHARLGGDQIPYLVELTKGISMVKTIMEMLNDSKPLRQMEQSHKVAKIHYFTFPQGIITHIDGVEAIRSLSYVHMLELAVEVGDQVPAFKDSMSRGGFVIVSGGSYSEVSERIFEIVEKLDIRVEPTISEKGTYK